MAAPKVTDETIIELYTKGYAMREIPADDQRIRCVLTEAGIPIRKPTGRSAKIERRNRAIIAGYKDGLAVGTLARQHECSIRVVNNVLQQFGLRKRMVVTVPEARPKPKPLPPVLGDPARAGTRLRRRMVERANRAKLDAWKVAAA